MERDEQHRTTQFLVKIQFIELVVSDAVTST